MPTRGDVAAGLGHLPPLGDHERPYRHFEPRLVAAIRLAHHGTADGGRRLRGHFCGSCGTLTNYFRDWGRIRIWGRGCWHQQDDGPLRTSPYRRTCPIERRQPVYHPQGRGVNALVHVE